MMDSLRSARTVCFWLLAGALCSLPESALALELPKIFASHMVLQRDHRVPLWGTAEPGSTVQVRFGEQQVTTRTGTDGQWKLTLEPMAASATGRPLAVTAGERKVTFENVLIGEVWLCSGQSNMAWHLRRARDAAEEITQADHPLIRLATVQRSVAGAPQGDVSLQWAICHPETIPSFSAVAYFFGRHLQQDLNVPIGLINSSWGGTRAEAWLSREGISSAPALVRALSGWEDAVTSYPMRLARWQEQEAEVKGKRTQWLSENPEKTTQDAERQFPLARRPLEPQRNPHIQAALYNGMIHPLAPYAIRGAIWYQGESNASRAVQYRQLLPLLIEDWRKRWGQGEFPFGIVQLANYRAVAEEPADPPWAHLRDAQRYTSLTVPNTGLIVTIDLGEADDIHPRNKQDVGRRLALWALSTVYGQEMLRYTGPVYESYEVRDSRVLIRFREFGGQLTTSDGQPPAEFTLCGADRQWVPARVALAGPHSLEVWAEGVDHPVAVRYGWANNPANPNLTNDSQIPASPFRTDNWPITRP